MSLKATPLAIADVIALDPVVHSDARGWFFESYKRSAFVSLGLDQEFVQDNHSGSEGSGVLRGLHFQVAPAAQGKLVQCVVGAIVDVAVDVRRDSPTFARWVSAELSPSNHRMIWIPPGFAHGFCTLVDGTEVVYKTTAEYSVEHERVIRWNDPALGIHWPTSEPILSDRDRDAPTLDELLRCESW